jgi:hypothetical protein
MKKSAAIGGGGEGVDVVIKAPSRPRPVTAPPANPRHPEPAASAAAAPGVSQSLDGMVWGNCPDPTMRGGVIEEEEAAWAAAAGGVHNGNRAQPEVWEARPLPQHPQQQRTGLWMQPSRDAVGAEPGSLPLKQVCVWVL